MDRIDYIFVDNIEKLNSCIDFLREAAILGIDTETTGLNPLSDKIRLLQIASRGNPVVVIDLWKVNSELKELKEILQGPAVKVFQNARFDLKFLSSAGFEVRGQIFDTMLGAKIIKSGLKGGLGLDDLARQYLSIDVPKEQQRSNWSVDLNEEQLIYSARDAWVLLPLREALIKEIREYGLVQTAKIEFDCVYAVAEMELSGIKLDMEKWNELDNKLKLIKAREERLIQEYLGQPSTQIGMFEEKHIQGINLDSPQQLLSALRSIGLNVNGTAREDLMAFAGVHPVINSLLEYKRVTKAIQGFTDNLTKYVSPKTKRLHPSYNQIGAATGRFSCSNPNIQQIPRGREFRSCFVPEKGNKLVIADYSQIELRVMAEISNDSRMIEAYREGQDLHILTASLMTGKDVICVTKEERQAAKAVNFGLIYAMGAKGLQSYARETYGVNMTLEDAEKFRNQFFKAYSGLAEWHSKIKRINPRESRTIKGRRIIFEGEPGAAALYNTPVQGTAADISKIALGMLVDKLKPTGAKIIGTVHDEIIIEVGEDMAQDAAKILKSTMEYAGSLCLSKVPVIAETIIADSWADK